MKLKTMLLLGLLGVAALALLNAKDVRRYLELRKL